jgi:CRP/FNR family transcriptional regulator
MSDLEELLNQGLLSEENGVSAETRALLTSESFSEVVNYKEDTLIVTQGGEPDALYFTISGIFHAISHANEQAPQRLLGRIEPGEFIGEVTLFDSESKASASVKAMRNASALKVTPESFEAFCKTHPTQALEFVSSLAKGLAGRLRAANEKVL